MFISHCQASVSGCKRAGHVSSRPVSTLENPHIAHPHICDTFPIDRSGSIDPHPSPKGLQPPHPTPLTSTTSLDLRCPSLKCMNHCFFEIATCRSFRKQSRRRTLLSNILYVTWKSLHTTLYHMIEAVKE